MTRELSRVFVLLIVAALWLTMPLTARAVVVSVNPVADAFVTSAQPNGNYGGAGALSIAAPGMPQGELQSLMRFDTSGAKSSFDATYGAGQWIIQSVSLQLTAGAPNNGIFNASAAGQFSVGWMQNDSWVEGTGVPDSPGVTGITYSTLPSFLGGSDELLGNYGFSGVTGGSFTYSLGLTPSMTADATAGGFLSLRLYAADAAVSYLFRSRSFTTVANRPVLSITAVPEPMSLMLVGVFGLLVTGRRDRRGPG